MKHLKTDINRINQVPLDRFTVLHFLFGVGMSKFKFKPYQAIFTAVSFELLEDVLKGRYPELFPNPSIDSKTNSLVDVLATLTGFGVGRSL